MLLCFVHFSTQVLTVMAGHAFWFPCSLNFYPTQVAQHMIFEKGLLHYKFLGDFTPQ